MALSFLINNHMSLSEISNCLWNSALEVASKISMLAIDITYEAIEWYSTIGQDDHDHPNVIVTKEDIK